MAGRQITVIVHSIAEEGPPPTGNDHVYTGRVAFIFDGSVVSGWPLGTGEDADGPYIGQWVTDQDVGKHGKFGGVTHWLEFPAPIWEIERQ